MIEELFPPIPPIVGSRFLHKSDGRGLMSKEERLFIHRFTSRLPEPDQVFRRKSEMTDKERRGFIGVARPLLEALGYET